MIGKMKEAEILLYHIKDRELHSKASKSLKGNLHALILTKIEKCLLNYHTILLLHDEM